jgi:hypothetical protein
MVGLALILRLRISEGVVLAPLGPDDFVRLVADAPHGVPERAREDRRKSVFCDPILTRASQIDGKLDIHIAAGHGTRSS